MGNLRWLVLAAAIAQSSVPQPPTNVRIISSTGSCTDGLIGVPPNCVPVPPAPSATGKQWKLVYAEEFSGTTLDLTKLTPCFDWNFGACTASFNTGKERYLPSQVQISNGTAKLVAEPLAPPYASSACYQGQCTYKAGLVSTARPLTASIVTFKRPYNVTFAVCACAASGAASTPATATATSFLFMESLL